MARKKEVTKASYKNIRLVVRSLDTAFAEWAETFEKGAKGQADCGSGTTVGIAQEKGPRPVFFDARRRYAKVVYKERLA